MLSNSLYLRLHRLQTLASTHPCSQCTRDCSRRHSPTPPENSACQNLPDYPGRPQRSEWPELAFAELKVGVQVLCLLEGAAGQIEICLVFLPTGVTNEFCGMI